MTPRLTLVPAVAALALLAGCAAPSLPAVPGLPGTTIEDYEDAVEQETGGTVDFTDAKVPADWPAELPIPPGRLIMAMSIDGAQTLQIHVDGSEVGEALVAQVVALGFADQGGVDTEQFVSHTLVRDDWQVVVGWITSDDEVLLTYQSGAH